MVCLLHWLLLSNLAACVLAAKQTVGAIFFGDWHPDPQHEALHGENWTEW
jgi:hypothetical protein